ncbi:hypothetical protein GCM10027431_26980 [Lysobacter rhizosphaerae]
MTNPHLTSIEADGWLIDDGEVAHQESPETFWIPPLAERQSLEPGSLVKIRFYIRAPNDSGELVDHGERMWVLVKARHDDWYLGALDNDPYCTDAIQAGMELWFQPRHIIDIDRGA